MRNFTLNCSGKIMDLSTPKVMAILNCTPDSFYDGGKFNDEKTVLIQVEKMLNEGADIIDIGGMSSRPNAEIISEVEELNRVLPITRTIHKHFPNAVLSIDTFRSEVAKQTIEEGVSIINDISAGTEDERIFDIAAQFNCPIILMHRKGNAQTMQQQTNYENILVEMVDYFIDKVNLARQKDVKDIVLDVGFGFSKTLEQNYFLLNNLAIFKQLDLPILAGLSRKSMLYNLLNGTPENALNATTAVNMIALQNGARLLRVHDVKEAVECVKIYNQLMKNKQR
ncbi:MAG: dihydropteroate synthase [Saprospirales bacterium]|nr:dihydropteroate synthase [Saprospirales bacterium]